MSEYRAWQDWDTKPTCNPSYGKWFALHSESRHVVQIVGPYDSEAEALSAAGALE